MQNSLTLSIREFAAYLVATFLSSSVLTAVVNWLISRQRQHAETVEIHARTVKVEAETRQVSTQTIIDAQKQLVSQGELIGQLQDELVEANRRTDNAEFDLHRKQRDFDQLNTRHALSLIQIERMHSTLKQHGLNYDNTQGVKVGDGEPQS